MAHPVFGKLRISLIAAVAHDNVIGANNALPWRLPEDLQHFKALTLGHPIIMGRKTFESIGRPLPGRRNIVITRNAAYAPSGCDTAVSLEAALALCVSTTDEVFIIGGAQIYGQAMPLADRLQLTEIDAAFVGDVRFPPIDPTQWRLASRVRKRAEAGFDFSFSVYERQH